jgi:cyclopropane fatty-acyl-phospholipid synthase-like methyltransferase
LTIRSWSDHHHWMNKPYSPACDRNKEPILAVLQKVLTPQNKHLLEIGSGTGQHAVYFAPHFPQVQWTTSEVASQHQGIRMWLEESGATNLRGPIEMEIGKSQIPIGEFDTVFSANVLHIISWEKGQMLFSMLGKSLGKNSQVLFYGPFNYGGNFTSQSNAEFDQWLKARDPESGIRSFEQVCRLMKIQGFELQNDFEMPSNNRLLHFLKN